MDLEMKNVCIYVSLSASLWLCHANLQVDVQCTQLCVDAISGCARVSEMHKGVSVSEHVHMWCVEHGVRVWVLCGNASVSCQCANTSKLVLIQCHVLWRFYL